MKEQVAEAQAREQGNQVDSPVHPSATYMLFLKPREYRNEVRPNSGSFRRRQLELAA